jgi:hypothetical protein
VLGAALQRGEYHAAATFVIYCLEVIIMAYNAQAAVAYAHKWAKSRNPRYASYSATAYGDSTNFVSQCLFAGGGQMNTTTLTGWYYLTQNAASRSWIDAEALYAFLTANRGVGPYGRLAALEQAKAGDVIQIAYYGSTYTQSLLVVASQPSILVAGHDYDTDYRNIGDYVNARRRLIRIEGSRGGSADSGSGGFPGSGGSAVDPGFTLPPQVPGWGGGVQPPTDWTPIYPSRPSQPTLPPMIPGRPNNPGRPGQPEYQTPMPF